MGSYTPQILALIFGSIAAILFLIWMAVVTEHLTKASCEPPPFYQCTPKGDWNAPNCKCWDSK